MVVKSGSALGSDPVHSNLYQFECFSRTFADLPATGALVYEGSGGWRTVSLGKLFLIVT